MRFLADECCDFAAVRCLRAQGHDVLAVSDFQQRSVDQDVMELALAENRILLTEDKDFGWLVFAGHVNALRALAACEAAAGSEPVLMALRATKDDENRMWGRTPVLRGSSRTRRPTSTSACGTGVLPHSVFSTVPHSVPTLYYYLIDP